jgi:hypothetical protein
LTLAYLNPAWFEFGRRNGGHPAIANDWGLGRNIMDTVPPALKDFYARFYGDRLRNGADVQPAAHRYECSSGQQFRLFAMHVFPLRDAAGLLIVNSVLVEIPMVFAGRTAHPSNYETYSDDAGIIRQCAHCRRIRAPNTANRWDWVPAWVEKPPSTVSHTLCGICLDYYYPPESPDHDPTAAG